MNPNVIRGVSAGAASICSVLFVALVQVVFDVDDQGLLAVLVAMTASATAISVHERLSKKYLEPSHSG